MDNGVLPSSLDIPGDLQLLLLGGTVLTFATCSHANFIFSILLSTL